jgi:hypothetical protein
VLSASISKVELLDEEDAVRLVRTEPAVALKTSRKTSVATESVYFITQKSLELTYQHLFERTPTTVPNHTRFVTGF